jgi:hypothetical protein
MLYDQGDNALVPVEPDTIKKIHSMHEIPINGV